MRQQVEGRLAQSRQRGCVVPNAKERQGSRHFGSLFIHTRRSIRLNLWDHADDDVLVGRAAVNVKIGGGEDGLGNVDVRHVQRVVRGGAGNGVGSYRQPGDVTVHILAHPEQMGLYVVHDVDGRLRGRVTAVGADLEVSPGHLVNRDGGKAHHGLQVRQVGGGPGRADIRAADSQRVKAEIRESQGVGLRDGVDHT